MRIDRYFINMRKIISYEEEKGNDTTKPCCILKLYQKHNSILHKLHTICDGTNISNDDKQYFFVTQNWDLEIERIRECSYLQQTTRDCIETAYKHISTFVEEAKKETNNYMCGPNTFTKEGRKTLRQIAFDFNKSTGAICCEINDLCDHYCDKSIFL